MRCWLEATQYSVTPAFQEWESDSSLCLCDFYLPVWTMLGFWANMEDTVWLSLILLYCKKLVTLPGKCNHVTKLHFIIYFLYIWYKFFLYISAQYCSLCRHIISVDMALGHPISLSWPAYWAKNMTVSCLSQYVQRLRYVWIIHQSAASLRWVALTFSLASSPLVCCQVCLFFAWNMIQGFSFFLFFCLFLLTV